MTTKYQMENLRVHFRQQVLADLPLTLEQWDKLRGFDAPPFPHAVAAVEVAQECNVPEILRPALYHLARSTFGCSGYPDIRHVHETVMESLGLLSRRASTCVIIGHQRLRLHLHAFLMDNFPMPTDSDLFCERCKGERELLIRAVDELWDDPLYALRVLMGRAADLERVSGSECQHEESSPKSSDINTERQEIWDELPYNFDIHRLVELS